MKNLILIRVCIMSDFFVIFVLKTVIYISKLLNFQNCESLELEHYNSDSIFYRRALNCVCKKMSIFLLHLRQNGSFTIVNCAFCRYTSLKLNIFFIKHIVFLSLIYCVTTLLLSSCTLVLFNYQNNLRKETLPVKNINSYFTNSDSIYLYQTEIRFMKNYYSGLMVIKSQNDSVKRLVFITEMGIKIFDIEIKNPLNNKEYYNVNYIIEPFSRKMLVKTLANDLGMLCQNGNVKFIDAFANDEKTFLRIKNHCKSFYYIYGMNEKNYSEIIVSSMFKQKSNINFFGVNNFAPDSIKLKHFGLNLNYVFRRITQ